MTLPDDSERDARLDPHTEASPMPADTTPADATPEALQREPLHFIVVVLLARTWRSDAGLSHSVA